MRFLRNTVLFWGVVSWGVVSFAQSEFNVWTEVGTKGKMLDKKMGWSFDWNTRFGNRGVNSFFPQAGLEYNITKKLEASAQYRASFKQDKFTNFQRENRWQFNLSYKDRLSRIDWSVRARYHYDFNRLSINSGYPLNSDHTLRFRPEIKYDIDNSIISPYTSIEYFLNLLPTGTVLDSYRFAAGIDFELDGPHKVDIGYLLNKSLIDSTDPAVHVLSVGYAYKF